MNGRVSEGGSTLRLLMGTLVVIMAIAFGNVSAQAQGVSAQQRRAAAEAYDRGTSAWLAGQYAQAAQWFETAHRLAPSPAALVQAIRSHKEAGNTIRAASLSLWLKAEYDDDPRANKVADGILEGADGNYTRVSVECNEECSITSDGKVQEYKEFFVEPGTTHEIVAGFQYGDKTETIEGSHGDTVELSFEAPPKPPEEEIEEVGPGGQPVVEEEPWDGLPLWATATMIGVTAGLAGATVWSAIDTNNAADTYEAWALAGMGADGTWGTDDDCAQFPDATDTCAVETQERYEEGQDLERRTNILIGVTAGVAATTAVFAIFFTDWDGSDDETVEEQGEVEVMGAGFQPQRGGGMAVVEGRF